MAKPKIIQAAEDGEYCDYLDQTYETIDHPQHEEYIKNENSNNNN